MGVCVDYIQKDKRSGRLTYRRVFPPELRRHVPDQRSEFKRSLGGKSLTNPIVAQRLAEAAAEYDRIISVATKAADDTFDPLNEETICRLAGAYFYESLERDEEARFDESEDCLFETLRNQVRHIEPSCHQGDSWENLEQRRRHIKRQESLEAYLASLRDAYATGNGKQIRSMIGEEAEEFSAAQGIRVDAASDSFKRLCIELLKASIKATEARLQRNAGQVVATPPRPEAPVASTNETTSQKAYLHGHSGPTLSEVVADLLRSKRDPITVSTQQSWEGYCRSFTDVHGDMPLKAITRRHVSAWLEKLAYKPSRLPAAERTLPLHTVLAKYADKDVPRLSSRTLNASVNGLGNIWRRAWAAGYLGDDIGRDSNPFTGHQIPSTTRREANPGLTIEQLKAVFNLPVFTRGERPVRGRGEAAFWIPLLLLWTGARPEEVAQLLVSDFSTDEKTGRLLIEFTDERPHPRKGARSLKTRRSDSGRRIFPVPDELIRIGLPDYIAWLRQTGEVALFPALTVTSRRRELHKAWAEWWRLYVRGHNALPASGNKPARDFRHTWTTAARASGLSESEREWIQGHVPSGKSSNVLYGSRISEGLAIDKLRFEGLDLSTLQWSPPT